MSVGFARIGFAAGAEALARAFAPSLVRSIALPALLTAGAIAAPASALAQGGRDPVAGKTKADQACAVCHGPLGVSQLPNAPNLAGQPAIYAAEQLKAYRSGKRQNEVMAVIAKPLTDAEIDDLAAWYASIAVEVKVK